MQVESENENELTLMDRLRDIYKRKQESKKERKQASSKESDQEKSKKR